MGTLAFGCPLKPLCPVVKCMGVYNNGTLSKAMKLYSQVALGLVFHNALKSRGFTLISKFISIFLFETKALLWEEEEYEVLYFDILFKTVHKSK